MIHRFGRVLLLGLCLAYAGCGSTSPKSTGSAIAPTRPLALPLTVVSAEGTVEGRTTQNAAFFPLEKGKFAADIVGVQTRGGGAVLEFGDAERSRGRLWIKDGSSIDLGQDAGGQVRVLVAKGEARLREGGRDVIFHPLGGKTEALETSRHLSDADWSLALETKRDPAGFGSMETRGENGEKGRLAIESVHVRAKRVGDFAETEVEQVFKNDSDRNLEGTFRFPVPDGAILIGFAMEVNDQLMEGELVEAEKARKTFETIVDSMQDPALLEWEQGNVFKLRVFPIEAKKNKKVVLRFTAPLHHDADGWQFVYPTAAAEMQAKIERFQLDFEGKSVLDEKGFRPGREVVVPVTGTMPSAFRETRADATYTTVRVRPDWSKMPAPSSTRTPRRVIAVIDTSRSSLEDRTLELDTLSMILRELRPEDRFMTVAADVSVRASGEFVEANAAGIAAAVAFVKSNEPDGASDLAAALKFAGGLAAKAKERHDGSAPEVVYIGDGTATWGETEPKALESIATASLSDVPFHAVILGKNADLDGMRAIASTLGGEVVRPRTALDAKRFALMLGHLPELRRLTHAHLAAQAKDVLFPARETTMIEGDEIVAVVKTPTGEALPSLLSFDAKLGGANYHEDIKVDAVHASTPRVAQRWAREQIAMLERGGDKEKLAVVKLSLDFGVMSQYTSFLVLESEEAYAKYDIERRQAKRLQAEAQKQASDPHVSGADLESVQARTARLDPDHLQPGDPEIHIPAPPDAQSVVVDLPFGETKIATYEAGQTNAWTVRFLIDKETPDGTYDVVVRITHKDGALEILHLSYVVDTKKPSVELSVRPAPRQPGTLEIRASQVITQAEITGANPGAQGTLDEMRKRYATVLTDAQRVEVRLPDGAILPLTAIRLGEFRGFWKPAVMPQGPINLHIVAVDRAMNQNIFDVALRVQ